MPHCRGLLLQDLRGRLHPPRRQPAFLRLRGRQRNTLERSFCPDCGTRLCNEKLSGFPGKMFVMLGGVDQPERIEAPMMEFFTAHRISWTKALDVPQYWARPDGSPRPSKPESLRGVCRSYG
ncbi:GFA family protein [Nocardia asiatica]|uniref:GFA family protein n=1 Tax=Nocardia asiatica TaxID=209252 RepID=UPI003EE2BC8C